MSAFFVPGIDMDLKDIKRTDADKAAEKAEWDKPYSGDDYPYGLCLHLDNQTMEKLGLTEKDFDAGQPVTISAHGFIKEDSIRKVDGVTKRSMTVQITALGLDQEAKKDDPAETLYGKTA